MIAKRGSYGRYLTSIFSLSDLILVNALFGITMLICPEVADSPRIRTLWLLVTVSYLPVMLMHRDNMHQQRVLLMDKVVKAAFGTVLIHALFFCSLVEFLGIVISLKTYAVYYGMMIVAVPLWWVVSRLIIKHIRRKGYNFLRVAIVGTNPTAQRIYEELVSDAGFGYKVLGFVSTGSVAEDFDGKVLCDVDHLAEYCDSHTVDQVFHAVSGTDEELLRKVLKIADDNMAQFYYVPQVPRRVARSFQLHGIGVMPVLSVRRNPLNRTVNRAIKRAFDIAFSSVVLIFSPIIFVPVAIMIKLSSPGPVFFKQERTGYKGRTFKCWKFRTMKVNTTADTAQATSHDPRTTRVGQFLRKSSIDELPQFINVWLGDMSIVGPRPHMLKHTEDYSKIVDSYMVRHVVKPGITGWAQVNGYRGITDELWKMERRVEYDVWYIENWTFLLDAKIIVRTVINAIVGEPNAF